MHCRLKRLSPGNQVVTAAVILYIGFVIFNIYK
jgi:hypothetical protein